MRTTLLWLAGLPLGPVPQRFDQQAYFAVWAVLLVLAVAALVVAAVVTGVGVRLALWPLPAFLLFGTRST